MPKVNNFQRIIQLVIERDRLQKEFETVRCELDKLLPEFMDGKYEITGESATLSILHVDYKRVDFKKLAMCELGPKKVEKVKEKYSSQCHYSSAKINGKL